MFQRNEFTSPIGGLHVAVGPDHGPAFVLLHGVLRQWTDFSLLMPLLATRHRAYGLDFRGHGLSARGESYRVVDYVEDAVAVVEQVAAPVILYGHSLGAMVALATAAACPQRISAVILEDPPLDTMGRQIHTTPFHSLFVGMQEALASSVGLPDLTQRLAEIRVVDPRTERETILGDLRDRASLRYSARCLQMIDPRVLDPIITGQWLVGYRLDDLLPQVRCPTLLLQADSDAGGMLLDQDAEILKSGLTDCSHVRFPGIGHLIHWQDSPRLMAVLGNFLGSIA